MDQHDDQIAPPVEIPMDKLSPEALSGVIADFILREGTDYGVVEVQHEKKSSQVLKQIERGDAKIVFDPNTESVSLVTKNEWNKMQQRRSFK